ncbi:MAG: LytTR family DNA-binding domain-containing protein [Chitinophagales bacterium]
MIRAVITDDESKARSALKQELAFNCPEVEIVGEADSVESALQCISDVKPELLFLDIQLSDGLGFHILERMQNEQISVIFTTAYSEYALKAFKTHAVDYLLKPISGDDLKQAVAKAIQERKSDQAQQLESLIEQLSKRAGQPGKIVLKDMHKTYFVKAEEIMYCEAEGIYTCFYLADGSSIMVSKNLKEYESILEPMGFIRTHHSFLVNGMRIKLFDKSEGGMLVLDNGKQIPVSQRKKDNVLKMLEKS